MNSKEILVKNTTYPGDESQGILNDHSLLIAPPGDGIIEWSARVQADARMVTGNFTGGQQYGDGHKSY